jgi:hypothetical protein
MHQTFRRARHGRYHGPTTTREFPQFLHRKPLNGALDLLDRAHPDEGILSVPVRKPKLLANVQDDQRPWLARLVQAWPSLARRSREHGLLQPWSLARAPCSDFRASEVDREVPT